MYFTANDEGLSVALGKLCLFIETVKALLPFNFKSRNGMLRTIRGGLDLALGSKVKAKVKF
jgi:hypothetical protein